MGKTVYRPKEGTTTRRQRVSSSSKSTATPMQQYRRQRQQLLQLPHGLRVKAFKLNRKLWQKRQLREQQEREEEQVRKQEQHKQAERENIHQENELQRKLNKFINPLWKARMSEVIAENKTLQKILRQKDHGALRLRNISAEVTQQQLGEELQHSYGPVRLLNVENWNSNSRRNRAFVFFKNAGASLKAAAGLRGTVLLGKVVKAEFMSADQLSVQQFRKQPRRGRSIFATMAELDRADSAAAVA